MNVRILLFFLLIFTVSGCIKYNASGGNMEKIKFTTLDGVEIVGNFWNSNSTKAILLLHMMPAVKESWNVIADDLNKRGYKVLAIDLRGHGESIKTINGRTLNYRLFSDEEHQKSIYDVRGAIEFLKNKGSKEFAIIGASIGANLALIYATEDNNVKTVVLMSPGLNYRGLETESYAEKYNKPILIIASEEDSYSAQSSRVLHEKAENSELILLKNRGHGTNMFSEPGLKERILNWINKNMV